MILSCEGGSSVRSAGYLSGRTPGELTSASGSLFEEEEGGSIR